MFVWARNCNGFAAALGVIVRFTMVWAPSASGRFREGPKIGQIGLGLAGGQKCSEMIIPKKEIIIDLVPA